MKVFVVYDRTDPPTEQSKADEEEYGVERRSTDVIDGDTQDCLVIWRSIVGPAGGEIEVVRMASTGVYEHITMEQATKLVNEVETIL